MSTIPKFASNKKCWQNLNKLVFGDSVSCPQCSGSLAPIKGKISGASVNDMPESSLAAGC